MIHDGKVIVQVDVLKTGGFVAALDVATGNEVWCVGRADVPTWSTPTVWPLDAGASGSATTLVLANGYRHIGAYDFATGREVWRMTGGGDIPVPTPITAHDLAFITNAHGRMAPVYAVRAGATGDISLAADATTQRRSGVEHCRATAATCRRRSSTATCSTSGATTASSPASTRAPARRSTRPGSATARRGFTSSPVAADGKIYFTSEQGDVVVVQGGRRVPRGWRTTSSVRFTCRRPPFSQGVLLLAHAP